MENTQPDIQALALTKAIRANEGGTNYQNTGDSGTSSGAYQFQANTWKQYSKDILGDENAPMTEANQNAVAYGKVKQWKDGGMGPAEIAAKWNSGSNVGWENKIGHNDALNVDYNVPKYVNNVVSSFRELYPQEQQKFAQPQPQPQPQEQPQPQQTQNSADTYGASFPYTPQSDTGVTAGLKAVGNLPSSIYNFGKGVVSMASHPIDTLNGISGVLAGAGKTLGQTIYNKTHGVTQDNSPEDADQQKFSNLVKVMKDRYGSMDNLTRTAVNDPVGFGSDVLGALEGGASLADKGLLVSGADIAKEGVKPISGALENTLQKTSDIATTPIKKAATGIYNLGTGIGGKALGVEGGALRNAISSTAEGGNAYKSFVEGLSGNTSQADLVDQARNALGEIQATRSQNYQQMLKTLKSDTTGLDMSPLSVKVEQQLKDFNITRNSDGTLNFDESTLGKASDQSAIQKMVNDVQNWKTNTPIGIDTLKQRLGNYWEPGSKTGAFSEGLRNTARNLLQDTPGYSDAMKKYSDMSDQITDIKKGLSLGDNAMVETSFKKLTGAFRQNNEFRAQLIQELDQATGGTLLPKIAGHQLSSWTPRGLMGTIEGGGAMASAMSGGTGLLPLLGTAMITSPKLVGELIRTLRLPALASQKVMGMLNKFAVPVVAAGNIAEKTKSGLLSNYLPQNGQ